MSKHIPVIIIILIFLMGLSVLLYPFVSDYYNTRSQSRVVESYYTAVAAMHEQDYSELFEAARVYNEKLQSKQNRFILSEREAEVYNSLLSFATGGIMGALEIDVINVKLPIYHGTNEAVLQIGIGHFEGTSLPVGGKGTHTVITGHRGLPSSTLLTNLDRLESGDTFSLRILNKTLWYRVDRILIAEPEDMSGLEIDPEMDYCTLITCTPYGINSHRLLVRGRRLEDPQTAEQITIRNEAGKTNVIKIMPAVLIPALLILIVIKLIRFLIKNHKRRKPL